jgi:hypothetical protein
MNQTIDERRYDALLRRSVARQRNPKYNFDVGLTTIGESCRAMFRETLGKTIAWVVEQVAQGQSLSQIKAHLALP